MQESLVRQQHEEDTKRIVNEHSTFIGKFLAKWDGKAIQEALDKSEHDFLAYPDCKCRKKITQTLEQEWEKYHQGMK